jgi:hydroxymethylglutaryl-CoA reductase
MISSTTGASWSARSRGSRARSLPLAYVLFSAVAGGVAGAIVLVVANDWAGMVAALLVFAASCGSYDPAAEKAAAE